jgi:hypothetical protein
VLDVRDHRLIRRTQAPGVDIVEMLRHGIKIFLRGSAVVDEDGGDWLG